MDEERQVHSVPNRIPNRILGFIKGRPVYEIRGGAEPVVEPGQQDVGDLLNDDDTGDTGGQGDPDTGGDPGNLAELIAQAVSAAVAPLQQQFQSELDRRIGQLTNRRQPNNQQQGQTGQQQQTGPQDVDVRDARGAYREAFQDSGLRLSAEERDYLNAGLSGAIRAQLAVDPDPDRAGTAVARANAKTIQDLRSHYQARTIAALRKRGALDEAKLQARTPNPAAPSGAAGDFQKGAQRAEALLAARGRPVKTNQ